jgi:membrane-associated protease RseP (regulator of RpoE activity)
MAPKGSTPGLTLFNSFCALLVVLLFHVHTLCAYQQVKLEITDNLISLEAEKVPLIDILKAISIEARLVLVTGDPMGEPVSLSLRSLSIEDAIERILAKRNFAVFYNLQSDGTLKPSEIHVFGNKSPITYLPAGGPPGQGDQMKHYSRDWYIKTFQQTKDIFGHIRAKRIQPGSIESDPLAIGIEVKHVAKDSAFSQIGIKPGDQIRDVNGTPIKSTEAFIQAMQSAQNQGSTIRIERLDSNNQIDPIYIELK